MSVKNGLIEKIQQKYQNSISIIDLVHKIIKIFENKNIEPKHIVPAIALCRDDSIAPLIYLLKKMQFSEHFSMQTLSGFPIFGITSIKAFYHHLHTDCMPGIIVYAPHIGISRDGTFGLLNRSGIMEIGRSCGANHSLIQKWTNNEFGPYENDPELSNVSQNLTDFIPRILNAPSPIQELVEVEYTLGKKILINYIIQVQQTESHNHPLLLVSGIHIDTPRNFDVDQPRNISDYFHLRSLEWFKEGEKKELNTN